MRCGRRLIPSILSRTPTVTHRVSVRVDTALDGRLERLAKLTGRTKSFFLSQAVVDQIQDLEDFYLVRKISQRVADRQESVVTLNALHRDLLDR